MDPYQTGSRDGADPADSLPEEAWTGAGLTLEVVGRCGGRIRQVVAQMESHLPRAVVRVLDPDGAAGSDDTTAPDLEECEDSQGHAADLILLILGTECPTEDVLSLVARLTGRGPVLVILDGAGDDVGLVAMEAGAEDWVALSAFTPQTLILRVIGRARAVESSRVNAMRADWEGETDRLGRLVGATSSVTARSFGSRSLRDLLPDLHVFALGRLNDLIDQAIEDRIFRGGPGIDSDLQALAESLGFARAGPRDIIDLYVTVLRSRDDKGPVKRRAVMMEESRIIALQLMGHLANYYRLRVIGTPPRRGEKDQAR